MKRSPCEQTEKQDQQAKKLRQQINQLRTELDEARDRVEEKLEESLRFAAQAAEASASNVEAQRRLTELQDAVRGNESVRGVGRWCEVLRCDEFFSFQTVGTTWGRVCRVQDSTILLEKLQSSETQIKALKDQIVTLQQAVTVRVSRFCVCVCVCGCVCVCVCVFLSVSVSVFVSVA